MDERILAVSDVDEGGIQGRQKLLHSSDIDIAYRVFLAFESLAAVFHQTMVLQQGHTYLILPDVYYQFLFHSAEINKGQFALPLKFYFFLCLFLRKRFLRLCVDILCLFLFLPLGIILSF